MRELRQHFGVQLEDSTVGCGGFERPKTNYALKTSREVHTGHERYARPRRTPPGCPRGHEERERLLHILRHGTGADSIYIVTYHRLEGRGGSTAPQAVEGAQGLIELLEHIGTDFHLASVRGALEDILRFGSATIPDVWLSARDLIEKDLEPAVP